VAKLTNILGRWVCGICTNRVTIQAEGQDEHIDSAMPTLEGVLSLGWKDFRTFQLCPGCATRPMSDDDYFFCEQRAKARSKALTLGLDFMIFGGEVHSATGVRPASVEELQLWARVTNIYGR